jgi:hypothetical protein
MTRSWRRCASTSTKRALGERNEIVLADALQHQDGRGAVARVNDEVRPLGRDGISLTPRQAHLFLRLLQKDAYRSLHDIERVVDVAVDSARAPSASG